MGARALSLSFWRSALPFFTLSLSRSLALSLSRSLAHCSSGGGTATTGTQSLLCKSLLCNQRQQNEKIKKRMRRSPLFCYISLHRASTKVSLSPLCSIDRSKRLNSTVVSKQRAFALGAALLLVTRCCTLKCTAAAVGADDSLISLFS